MNKPKKTLKLKQTYVWSIVNGERHPALTKKEQRIDSLFPLIGSLFPGMNFYSLTGIHQVLQDYVRPVMIALFPELEGMSAHKISIRRQVTIRVPLLPCKGYEYLDKSSWRSRFKKVIKDESFQQTFRCGRAARAKNSEKQ